MTLKYEQTKRTLLRGDSEVLVRVMTREDIPALRVFDDEATGQLREANAQVPPGREEYPGGPWSNDEWLAAHFERYSATGNITLLAEDVSGRIAGFADLWVANEPEPFGKSLDVECIDYFRECYYLGLEIVLLEEAEKVANAAGLPALDIGSNTASGDYPSLRRFGMKVFYECDDVLCSCAAAQGKKRPTYKMVSVDEADLSGLFRVGHWAPTDFSFRGEAATAWLAEIKWDGHRAILELWHFDAERVDDTLPVPGNVPNGSELYAEPDVMSSAPEMQELLTKCACLAGETGAEAIPLPCPSSLQLSGEMLDVIGREFRWTWFRKSLGETA